MLILAAVLAHTALFHVVGGGSASFGAMSPWILALASVCVGTLASLSEYVIWLQRLFWLLALVAAFVVLPEVIKVGSEQMATIPAGLREIWLMVAVAPVPLGMVLGVVRVWR